MAKTPILALSRKKLILAQVKGSSVEEKFRESWDVVTLEALLGKVHKQRSLSKVRILLSEDLSHYAQFTLDNHVADKDIRQTVADRLATLVPEEIHDKDWDFKVVETTKKEKEIFAFVPVEQVFTPLTKTLSKLNIAIEAVEPEAVAKLRNENPFIGLSLKKDLTGKDTQTLNISTEKQTAWSTQRIFYLLIGLMIIVTMLVTASLTYFSNL
mgnify:CR=1 FL=1